MPANFLNLHIVDFCQLDCKHCYLNKGSRVMPLDMLEFICEDFLKTAFPLPQSELILSGGEPLLHPDFIEASMIVRKLNGHITMSTNGILIPKYIHTFKKNDGIQISVDGDEKAHDFIRGKGSYEKASRGNAESSVTRLKMCYGDSGYELPLFLFSPKHLFMIRGYLELTRRLENLSVKDVAMKPPSG